MDRQSLWKETVEIPRRNSLNSTIKTDVCVIGGGMAGLLTAYKLKERGFDVVVVEASSIASGQTGNTTAKITCQHGVKYSEIISTFGEEKARLYAQANEKAIDEYEKIIEDNHIKCEFERLPSYLYSLKENNKIDEEFSASQKCGIDCCITEDTHLPFKVKRALMFPNQAQFNPLKFIKSIAQNIRIYENTKVTKVKGNLVLCEKGKVYAREIVFATHFPIVNTRGMYFSRMCQSRSYGIAVRGGKDLKGIYYSPDKEGLSLRNYKNFTIIVGESHTTGDNEEGKRYDRLRQKALQIFPSAIEVAHWSAQDTMTIDSVPFIGKYCVTTPHWYVATGFGKWGMSSSMVSAMIISDMISGKENEYEKVFSPQRFNTASGDNLMRMGGKAIKGISTELFKVSKENIDDVEVGVGKVIEYGGEKVGVYKESSGEIYMVDVKCPHMGCELKWNNDEKIWECPCHGSRFSYKGKLIDNPAKKGLKQKTLITS